VKMYFISIFIYHHVIKDILFTNSTYFYIVNQENTGELSSFSEQIKSEAKTQMRNEDGNVSDQSADVLPHPSPTVETLSSSNASSPAPFKCEESSKDHNHDQGHDGEGEREKPATNSQSENDPSRISWESGSVPAGASPSRVTVKLLVSNNMAGSIIGRQGQTVSELQNKSSAKIRLSQSGDYFPGTSDRVCLIHGSLENVKKGVALVLGKLYELQLELVETQLGITEQIQDDSDGEFEESEQGPPKINFATRILVPSAACGMLIGKEGATIQRLKENVGASSVRLSPKVVDHNIPRTFERVLTVSAFELRACVSFAASILDGFVRHPEICRYLNGTTSYSRNSNVSYNTHRNAPVMGFPGSASPTPNAPLQGFATHSHSIHDVDTGLQSLGFESNVPSSHNQRPAYINASTNAMGGNSMVSSSPQQVSSFLPQRSSPSPSSYNSTINLAVPDAMVGAVLGRRGQTLQELQSESGARIRVSQRNEFVPGTTNRIVTVSGSQESVTTARNMIRQLLSRNP
jgi:RNA-binding protein Nova